MADPASIGSFVGLFIASAAATWTGYNQTHNRKFAHVKDGERRAELHTLQGLVHELTTSVAVVNQAVGDMRGELRTLRAVVEVQGRTLERVQDRLDARERKP